MLGQRSLYDTSIIDIATAGMQVRAVGAFEPKVSLTSLHSLKTSTQAGFACCTQASYFPTNVWG